MVRRIIEPQAPTYLTDCWGVSEADVDFTKVTTLAKVALDEKARAKITEALHIWLGNCATMAIKPDRHRNDRPEALVRRLNGGPVS